MRHLAAIAAATLLAGAAAPTAPATVDELGWLAGIWLVEEKGGWTEERWAPPRGGVMLGTVLSGKGGSAGNFEFMRIAADAQGVPVFWASPQGKAAVPFRYAGGGRREARFANEANDYPNLIVYRRDGRRLTGTISRADGSDATSWSYGLRK